MTSPMVPWPDPATFIGLPNESQYGDQWAFERMRADAAMQRLRMAHSALIKAYNKHVLGHAIEGAPIAEALSAIGELPAEGE